MVSLLTGADDEGRWQGMYVQGRFEAILAPLSVQCQRVLRKPARKHHSMTSSSRSNPLQPGQACKSLFQPGREVNTGERMVASKAAVAAAAGPCSTLRTICMPLYFGQTATALQNVCGKVKILVHCSKCSVALCFTVTRNCFEEYHMRK